MPPDHLNRSAALERIAARLARQRPVEEQDRSAVLDAIADAHADRGVQLSDDR